ncbi:MAG: hypothetical protein ACE10D_12140, partial [Planctomycetota bacterium]
MYSDDQIWRYVDGLMEAGDAQRLEQQAEADEELQARIEQCRLIRSEVLAALWIVRSLSSCCHCRA